MFYAHFVLSKKGPLARIWLAAHWDKKLTKAHVFETNIEGSVKAIIEPKVKLALRTSGHLLLGVVRIYSRKAKYLLADCNEAFVKIKMAFRPGVVDMPEENREAAVSAITLPETFHDFDTAMAELTDIDVQAQFSVNQSRPEEITMREDLGNITLVGDDGFGDMGFDGGTNMIQDTHMDDTLYVKNPESNLMLDSSVSKETTEKPMDIDFDAQPKDGFGDGIADFEGPAGVDDDDDSDNDNFGGGVDDDLFGENFMGEGGGLFEEPPVPEIAPLQAEAEAAPHAQPEQPVAAEKASRSSQEEEEATPAPEVTTVPDQTTLIPNEDEAFALEPIDATTMGTQTKVKRKRKLIIDEQKGIASETMKLQLSDTSDITTTLDLAPPTKKLMHWKETGGVEKLFALPGRPMVSKRVTRFFNKNLVTRSMLDKEAMELEAVQLELQERLVEEESAIPEFPQSVMPEPEMPPPPPIVERFEHGEVERRREGNIDVSHTDNAPIREPSIMEAPSLEESRLDLHPETSTMSHLPDESSMVQSPGAMTRSRLQEQVPEPEPEMLLPEKAQESPASSEDHDDAVFTDLPNDLDQELDEGTGENGEEDLEEQRWSKRTQQMMHILNRSMTQNSHEDTASFNALVSRNNRKQVASKFYTILVLKKLQAVNVEQSEPYGDITISQGPRFGTVY